MSDYFNVNLTQKGQRLWVVLPGLLGQSNDLIPILPENDSFLGIDYNIKIDATFSERILALSNLIKPYSQTYDIYGIGYSMGGRLLYSLIQQNHDLFKKCVFISSGLPLIKAKDRYLKQRFDAAAKHNLNTLEPYDFLTWWYTLPIYKTLKDRANFDEFITKKSQSFNQKKITYLLQAYSSLLMPIETQKISLPCHYFAGEHDDKYQLMHQKLPTYFNEVTFTSVPNASHLCHWESPQFFEQCIKKWAN